MLTIIIRSTFSTIIRSTCSTIIRSACSTQCFSIVLNTNAYQDLWKIREKEHTCRSRNTLTSTVELKTFLDWLTKKLRGFIVRQVFCRIIISYKIIYRLVTVVPTEHTGVFGAFNVDNSSSMTGSVELNWRLSSISPESSAIFVYLNK